MATTKVETYGKLLLTQLFTNIWYGHWDKYEETIEHLPIEMAHDLPFHPFYEPRKVKLAHENYFVIPGDYFIPPYVSFYYGKSEEAQQIARQDLLCLAEAYEKVGYYYQIENDELPDHIGSITCYITALLQEKIKAYDQGDDQLIEEVKQLQREVYNDYLKNPLEKIEQIYKQKVDDQFFKYFFPFYKEILEMIVHS